MNDLVLFLLTRALTQNSNTIELVKFLKLSHEQKQKLKKKDNPRFYGQNKHIFRYYAFSPWAISSVWLHIGAPQKAHEK
jgi:hypothetical protein